MTNMVEKNRDENNAASVDEKQQMTSSSNENISSGGNSNNESLHSTMRVASHMLHQEVPIQQTQASESEIRDQHLKNSKIPTAAQAHPKVPPPPLLNLFDNYYEQRRPWWQKMFRSRPSNTMIIRGPGGIPIKYASKKNRLPWHFVIPVVAFAGAMFAYPFFYARTYTSQTDPFVLASTAAKTTTVDPAKTTKHARGAFLNSGSREVPEDVAQAQIFRRT